MTTDFLNKIIWRTLSTMGLATNDLAGDSDLKAMDPYRYAPMGPFAGLTQRACIRRNCSLPSHYYWFGLC